MPREYTFFFRRDDYSLWEKLDRIPAQEFYDAMSEILLREGYSTFPECYGTDKRASMLHLMKNCNREHLNTVMSTCFEEFGKKGDILNCLIVAHPTFEIDPDANAFVSGDLRNANFELVKQEFVNEKVVITGFLQTDDYVDVRLTSKSTHYEPYEEDDEEQVDVKEYDQNIEIRCYPNLGLSFVTRHYKSQEKLSLYVDLIVQALSERHAQISSQILVLQEEQLLIIQSGLRGEMRGGTLQLSNEPVRLTFDGRKTLEAKSSVLLNLAQRSGKYQSIEFLFYDQTTGERHRMRILGSEASVVTTGEVQPSVVNDLVQHLVVAREMQDFMRDPDRTLYHLIQGKIHTAPEAMKSRLTHDIMRDFENLLSNNVKVNPRDSLWSAIRSAGFNILADMAVQTTTSLTNTENYTATYKSITQLIHLFREGMSPLKIDEINALLDRFTCITQDCDNPFTLMKKYAEEKGAKTLVDPLVSTSN